jgi:glucose/arabinose dehydrogenase
MRAVLAGILALLAASCSAVGQPAPFTNAASPSAPGPAVRAVAQDLTVPWGVDFLPGGDVLVAERPGRIVRVATSGEVSEVGSVPGVRAVGEGGLLGLVVSPRFATDHLVYVYFTSAGDNRIVRMTYQDGRLGEPRVLVSGIPAGTFHDGGRLVFGPDGMLYAGTGEAGQRQLAQRLDSLGGKILRMTPDGQPAPGNPFPGSLVYSFGHRNVQGLAFDSRGRLWASEFGQDTWDELNLIRPGGNYGWPVVEGRAGRPEYIDPLAQWRTSEASPSGIAIINDVVWMAALRGERLWRIPLRDDQVDPPQALFTGTYGRLRTALRAPDGSLWLTTSNTDGRGNPRSHDDKILQLTPN